MKRWVIVITICILIGAIINVVVAWWFAIRLDGFAPAREMKFGISYDGPGYVQWNVNTNIWRGSTWSLSQSFSNSFADEDRKLTANEALPYWAQLIIPDANAKAPYSFKSKHAVAHGWPVRSMLNWWDEQLNKNSKDNRGLAWFAPDWLRGKPAFPDSRTQPAYLPLKIIWPGFVANSLLYAIVMFLIFIMKFKLRSYLRLKRKQCSKCGYPIGQSEVCTECGAKLKMLLL